MIQSHAEVVKVITHQECCHFSSLLVEEKQSRASVVAAPVVALLPVVLVNLD